MVCSEDSVPISSQKFLPFRGPFVVSVWEIRMFRKALSGLCRDRRGLAVVAGAIGVLRGVECLLSTRDANPARVVSPALLRPEPVRQQPRIKITQTKSELGFVYWVVREVGGDPSYTLFDTWQEAMDEAARRMNAAKNAPVEHADSSALISA